MFFFVLFYLTTFLSFSEKECEKVRLYFLEANLSSAWISGFHLWKSLLEVFFSTVNNPYSVNPPLFLCTFLKNLMGWFVGSLLLHVYRVYTFLWSARQIPYLKKAGGGRRMKVFCQKLLLLNFSIPLSCALLKKLLLTITAFWNFKHFSQFFSL